MKIAQTPKSTITSSKFVPTTLSFNNPCASSRLASCPQIARSSRGLEGYVQRPGLQQALTRPPRKMPFHWHTQQLLKSAGPKSVVKTSVVKGSAAPLMSVPASWLLSASVFLLGAALAAVALCAIPLLLELKQTAKRVQTLAEALEREIPDTAATMRLTGLEMSDAIQEISLLGADVTGGLQASAQLVQDAESGLKQCSTFMQTVTAQRILPAVRQRVPIAKGHIQELLITNSGLQYTQPTVLQLAVAAKTAAKRVRVAVSTLTLMSRASAYLPQQSSRA